MSRLTYRAHEAIHPDKPLVWIHGEVRTPPLSAAARLEAGVLLRRLQRGETLGLPHSRPMPSIGPRCHEIGVRDENRNWRIIYRIDSDAIVILDVFDKKTSRAPAEIIAAGKRRVRQYDSR